MTDYQFPKVPEIERAYRGAHRALLRIVPAERTLGRGEDDLQITELITHMRTILEEAETTVAAQLGPLASWRAPRREGDWALVTTGIDLDEAAHDFGDVVLDEGTWLSPDGEWSGSTLERAARAYRREARWDFAPGQAGIWLLMLAPVSGCGGDERPWIYNGHLVGFVILHDRDKDGVYESVAHIWTASAWRRRGIARTLLAEAKSRFPLTGVEGPCTDDGEKFLESVGQWAREPRGRESVTAAAGIGGAW